MRNDEPNLAVGCPWFERGELHEVLICILPRMVIFRSQEFSVAQPFPYIIKFESLTPKRNIQELAGFLFSSYFSSSPRSPGERNVPRMILNKEPLFWMINTRKASFIISRTPG